MASENRASPQPSALLDPLRSASILRRRALLVPVRCMAYSSSCLSAFPFERLDNFFYSAQLQRFDKLRGQGAKSSRNAGFQFTDANFDHALCQQIAYIGGSLRRKKRLQLVGIEF